MQKLCGLLSPGKLLNLGLLLIVGSSTVCAFVVTPNSLRPNNQWPCGCWPSSSRNRNHRMPADLKAAQEAPRSDLISRAEIQQGGSGTAELGFSFSVAGLFFAYHLGVAEVLQEEELLNENTPLAGASGGALAAVAIALGLDGKTVVERTEQMCKDIRADGGKTKGRLAGFVRPVIDEILPEDAHSRLNSYPGGIGLGLSAWKPFPSKTVISSFKSRDDLIDVMLASSHFPFWLSPWPFKRVRWFLSMDGFFAARQEFGCPKTPAAATVCVSPFLEEQVFKPKEVEGSSEQEAVVGHGDGVISPQLLRREGRGRLDELLPVALDPSDDEELLMKTFEGGRRDAAVWVQQYRNR